MVDKRSKLDSPVARGKRVDGTPKRDRAKRVVKRDRAKRVTTAGAEAQRSAREDFDEFLVSRRATSKRRAVAATATPKRVRAKRVRVPGRGGGQLQPDGSHRLMYRADRPVELLDYFRRARELMEDPERVVSKNNRIEYVTRPIRLPSFAAWATSIGVAPRTVSRWALKHPEFAVAVAQAKGIFEAILLDLASTGAIDHRWAQFLLRCNHGYSYTEQLEVKADLTLEPIARGRDQETSEREVGASSRSPVAISKGASPSTPVAVLKSKGRKVALLDRQDLEA